LGVKKHPAIWPVGIVGVVAYFIFFYQLRLYAEMALQIVFLAQSFYGWYYWLYGATDQEASPPIRQLQPKALGLALLLVLLLWLFFWWFFAHYTQADLPQWDTLVLALSLVANTLLAKKIIDNWWLWIVADLLSVGIFIHKAVYLSAATYLLFTFMAIHGLRTWKKSINTP
jgi:nicotinamide mononucleotide transporter